MSERLPFVPGYGGPTTSKAEFYKYVLKAIRRRRGLIHGKFEDLGRVCAMAAASEFAKSENFGTVVVKRRWAEEIQKVNDSVPEATPAERLKVVIDYLERKLA